MADDDDMDLDLPDDDPVVDPVAQPVAQPGAQSVDPYAYARQQQAGQPAASTKPRIARKWQRRFWWTVVLLFGVGVYFGASHFIKKGPTREVRPEKMQKALDALAPKPLAVMLPLKEPWRKAEPLKMPVPAEQLTVPKIDVPRLVLLQSLPHYTEKTPTTAKGLALAYDTLVRRDLSLVSGLSLLDVDHTPDPKGSLKDHGMRLATKLEGHDLVAQMVVTLENERHYIQILKMSVSGANVSSGPKHPIMPGKCVEVAQVVVKELLSATGAQQSKEGRKYSNAWSAHEGLFEIAARTLRGVNPGTMQGSWDNNVVLNLAQVRFLPRGAQNMRYLNSVTVFDRYNAEAYMRKEWSLLPDRGHEVALQNLDQAIEFSPHYGIAYLHRSRRKMNMGLLKDAAADGVKAVSLMPSSAEAYAQLAEVYIRNNAPGLARVYADRALKMDIRNPEAHAVFCRTYIALNQPELAVNGARDFLKLFPEDTGAAVMLAQALKLAGKTGEALEVLDQAPADKLPPERMVEERGEVLYWEGRIDEASKLVEEMLAKKPNDPDLPKLKKKLDAVKDCATSAHKVLKPEQVIKFREAQLRATIHWRNAKKEPFRTATREMEALAPKDPHTLRNKIKSLALDGLRYESLEAVQALKATGVVRGGADIVDEVEALMAHARFEEARKVVIKEMTGHDARKLRRRLESTLAFREGIFYADFLNDFEYARTAFLKCLQEDEKDSYHKEIADRMVKYLDLLGRAEKFDEATAVIESLGRRLEKTQAKRLKEAMKPFEKRKQEIEKNKGLRL